MTNKSSNPWDSTTAWKDEKAFLNWLRSQTRRIWSRHPVKNSYKNMRRYKAPIGKNGREIWACKCEMCGKEVASSKAEIDHIKAGGSFHDWQSYTEWAKRILWVSHDDIRELCRECHSAVTYSQSSGLSIEDARKEKAIIEKCKQKIATQKAELLKAGFKEEDISNAEKRRECYRKMLGGSDEV